MHGEFAATRCLGPEVLWVALLAVLLLACAHPAHALSGGDTVTTNVVLNQDLMIAASGGNGLVVGADNLTIDGNGHSIVNGCKEMLSRYGVGIRVGSRQNITIKNFNTISGFRVGIDGNGNGGITIENCRIESCMQVGVSLFSAAGVTIRDCVFREAGTTALRFDSCGKLVLTLSRNTMIGGRAGMDLNGGPPLQITASDNRFFHQLNDYASEIGNNRTRLGLLRFNSVLRHANVADKVDFSATLSTLTGEAAGTVACVVRTIPEETLVYSRSGALVSGSFHPSRNGLYSVVAEATDSHGNSSLRVGKIQVGPLAAGSVKYYMSGMWEGPVHGPGAGGLHDHAGMNLIPPSQPGSFQCGFYVNWYVDRLPLAPAASINKVRIKTLLSFNGATDIFSKMSSSRIGTKDISQEKMIAIPNSLGNGAVNWGEFEMGGLDWPMDYPQDWYFMALSFFSNSPKIYTGDPAHWGHPAEHLSHTLFDYTTTVSPEVRVVSNPALLLMGATAPVGTTGMREKITVWGANDQADLKLANFRRPFVEVPTEIRAAGEAFFASGLVVGEKTFTAVPLDVQPTAAAVRVQVVTWPAAGNGPREWTEAAVGAPGAVAHTLSGLLPLGAYRITVGGGELLVGTADAQGKLAFVYGGTLPATFVALLVPANNPPAIVSVPWAMPNPVTLPNFTTVNVVASDPDGGPAALTYTWAKASGPGVVTFSPNGTTGSNTSAASFGLAGTYSLKVTISDGAASVTDSVTVTANPSPLAPIITTQPVSVTVAAGQTATFSVSATGTAPLSYQWRKNGANISGANSASYSTPATTAADNGALFAAVVSNLVGSATSSNAKLTIADTTGPVLEVGSVVLNGTISDVSGVASLKVNGAAVTVGAGGTWQKETPLIGATTVVTLSATDNLGNVTNKAVTVAK